MSGGGLLWQITRRKGELIVDGSLEVEYEATVDLPSPCVARVIFAGHPRRPGSPWPVIASSGHRPEAPGECALTLASSGDAVARRDGSNNVPLGPQNTVLTCRNRW